MCYLAKVRSEKFSDDVLSQRDDMLDNMLI